MPLTRVEPGYPDTEVDIIAVPAVGADPKWAWKHPERPKHTLWQDSPPFKTIFDNVRRAQVYLYTYPDPLDGDAIANYATDLLKSIDALVSQPGNLRPLHFAGHNSGGLVVKKALVLAKASTNKLWNSIASGCFTVAFFGVPHYGSDVLSDETYVQSVREILGTPTPEERLQNEPTVVWDSNLDNERRARADRIAKTQKWRAMEDQLRSELSADNREKLMQLSRDFAPLALGLRKIWTFVEAYPTDLSVLTGGGKEGEELETVELSVVDRRSATLSNSEIHIGSEKVVPVDCEHGHLSKFGVDEESFDIEAFKDYIEELQSLIRALRPDESRDLSWIEEELPTDVHVFYEATSDGMEYSIKLWSASPSLHELLHKGPRQCLNERLKEVRDTEAAIDRASRRNRSLSPSRSARRERAASITAIGAMADGRPAKSLSRAYSFRPPHLHDGEGTPTAPKRGNEDDVSRVQWIRGRRTRSDLEAQSQNPRAQVSRRTPSQRELPTVNWAIPTFTETPPTPPLEPSSNRNAKSALVADRAPDVPSIVVEPPSLEKDTTEEDGQIGVRHEPNGSIIPDSAQNRVVMSSKSAEPQTKLATGPPSSVLGPKRLDEEVRPAKRKNYQVPSITSRRFRWIHIPCNNMLFVQRAFQTIAEEKKKPRMFENLLKPQSWAFKKHIGRHNSPHACFMEPHFEAMNMTRSLLPGSAPTDDLQMAIYLPYLHWDNFGALCDRNDLISRRLLQERPYPVDEEIAQIDLLEPKLLWQYLVNPAGLPIHHRRSLDQYRYPTLRSTAVRDADQVLYKRTRPATNELPHNETSTKGTKSQNAIGRYANASSRLLARTRSRSDSLKQGRRTHRTTDVRHEDRSKVLMVDQLWCWVADGDTVLTCFTPKEERDGDPPFKPADLRNAIYNNVNGDSQFATKCDNPYDFMALVVCDAITVFLDGMQERDLQVFRIFEDYISQLTEEQTESFKRFRDDHRDEMMGRLDRYSQAPQSLVDSGSDLANYLELRDIEDELTSLLKLFNEQLSVLQTMISKWNGIMAQINRKLASKELLTKAVDKIASYKSETKRMIDDCHTAQDASQYEKLLDMKQKQANVDEMWLARQSTTVAAEQGRAIMFFTIFTIVFLPLSFFTSFFGMNVREWSGQSTNLPIHTVGVLMGSISAALIVVALLLAFNKPIYQAVAHTLQQGIKLPFVNQMPDLRMPWRTPENHRRGSMWRPNRYEKTLPQHVTVDGDIMPMVRKRNTD
ncbi:hypothetical protein EV356DRAFT_238033 [Viridothelium virens]|uniref:Cora-domain-containing protein n=1 Tax=Viridothelium virens TaxID=1048519 RepID=A0A6A6H4M9_VIRVR|nr:hypothetical protein EV356DRAFT_238033 [Viridothelium virens]